MNRIKRFFELNEAAGYKYSEPEEEYEISFICFGEDFKKGEVDEVLSEIIYPNYDSVKKTKTNKLHYKYIKIEETPTKIEKPNLKIDQVSFLRHMKEHPNDNQDEVMKNMILKQNEPLMLKKVSFIVKLYSISDANKIIQSFMERSNYLYDVEFDPKLIVVRKVFYKKNNRNR